MRPAFCAAGIAIHLEACWQEWRGWRGVLDTPWNRERFARIHQMTRAGDCFVPDLERFFG